MMEELFKKTVPVSLKSNERDERQVSIGVTILLNTVASPVHKKELLIRLTDQVDPFFLYTLALSEEDFQGLKAQQGLLVDFGAFPQKLIDLLELCLSEMGKDNPKFLLQFCECTNQAVSLLHVVETNPFRHLNHLSLKFVPASDVYLKKYLAECLLQLKEENAVLSNHLTSTKSDLSARLAQCEEALSKRTQELERVKSDWSSHTVALTSEHSSSINAEREKALQGQVEVQARFEQAKKEMEQAHLEKLGSIEARLQELDLANKELTDVKYQSEATVRELTGKLKSVDKECSDVKEELQKLRKENSSLDANNHEQDKTLTQLRTRMAVLEQELQDKEQVIARTTELLEASQQQKRSYEVQLEQRERQITKLDTAFKSASQEVLKGNEIIQKLQLEIRSTKSKLKVKSAVTTKQDTLLGDKDKTIEKLKLEVESLNHSLSLKQEELSKTETSAEELRVKLEEAREQLKTNENVITWLNKQMNEQMLGRASSSIPPSGSSTTLSAVKSLPALSSSHHAHYNTTATSTYAGLLAGMQLQKQPQFSSTPTSASDTTSSNLVPLQRASLSLSSQRNVLGSLGSQENIGRQQVLFKGGKKTVPSPLTEHAHTAGGGTLPSNGKESKSTSSPHAEGEPWLHPKYLPQDPPADDETVPQGQTPNIYASITPGVMKTQGVLQKGIAAGRGTGGRGGKLLGKTQLQGGRGIENSGRLKSTMFTSSYFPKS